MKQVIHVRQPGVQVHPLDIAGMSQHHLQDKLFLHHLSIYVCPLFMFSGSLISLCQTLPSTGLRADHVQTLLSFKDEIAMQIMFYYLINSDL